MLHDILSPAVRRVIYVAYAVLGVGLGAIEVWYATAGVAGPEWTAPALAVYAFVGGALGLTAASNTPREPAAVVERPDGTRETGTLTVGPYDGDHL